MTPDNDRILCEKYPEIFRDRFESPSNSAMCYGFECDDGWFTLIDRLCACLQNEFKSCSYGKSEEEKQELQPVAAQVKSKFGGLRFYIEGGNETMYGMIRMAESLSFTICETCGKSGSKKGNGWIFTLCDNCWEERNKRNFSCK